MCTFICVCHNVLHCPTQNFMIENFGLPPKGETNWCAVLLSLLSLIHLIAAMTPCMYDANIEYINWNISLDANPVKPPKNILVEKTLMDWLLYALG